MTTTLALALLPLYNAVRTRLKQEMLPLVLGVSCKLVTS